MKKGKRNEGIMGEMRWGLVFSRNRGKSGRIGGFGVGGRESLVGKREGRQRTCD